MLEALFVRPGVSSLIWKMPRPTGSAPILSAVILALISVDAIAEGTRATTCNVSETVAGSNATVGQCSATKWHDRLFSGFRKPVHRERDRVNAGREPQDLIAPLETRPSGSLPLQRRRLDSHRDTRKYQTLNVSDGPTDRSRLPTLRVGDHC